MASNLWLGKGREYQPLRQGCEVLNGYQHHHHKSFQLYLLSTPRANASYVPLSSNEALLPPSSHTLLKRHLFIPELPSVPGRPASPGLPRMSEGREAPGVPGKPGSPTGPGGPTIRNTK